MKAYLFTNITGIYIIDKNMNLLFSQKFDDKERNNFLHMDIKEIGEFFEREEEKTIKKFLECQNNKNIEIINLRKNPEINPELLNNFLGNFSNKDFFEYSRKLLFKVTAKELSIVEKDTVISQDVDSLKQLIKVFNMLVKRIKEYYSFFYPELVNIIEDDEFLVSELYHRIPEEILNKLGKDIEIKVKTSEEDISLISSIVKIAFEVKELTNIIKEKIEKEITEYCPKTAETATPLIAAKLLKKAGGLKELAMMSSSKVQLLGAEKALFRHLKTGTKPPKYGIIYQHPDVLKADKKSRGKVARRLASQIVLSARMDYFSKLKNH